MAHVTKQAPKIRDVDASVPAPLADIVDRCLAKEPAQRFQSAGELCDALTGLSPAVPRPSESRRDALLSEKDARAVWDRAATLQAQATGTVTPIAAPARDAERQPVSPSSAYRVEVVRDSAREAGISTEYVDRALAERGLGGKDVPSSARPSANVGPMAIRDIRVRPVSPWAGAPSSIELEIVVDGEV